MQITERIVDGVTILDLSGNLTKTEGEDLLHEKVVELVRRGQVKLVLNLGALVDLDSSGINDIVRASVAVGHEGGTLRLLSLLQHKQDSVAFAELETDFDAFEVESDAVASFSSRTP